MNNRIDLVAGQNCPLPMTALHVSVSHGAPPPGLAVDASAFLLDAAGKVAGDEDFIFFNQPAIEVRLDSHRNDQFMCAVAMLENINNQLRITKLADYFAGHQQLDQAYGWGLNYVKGSK